MLLRALIGIGNKSLQIKRRLKRISWVLRSYLIEFLEDIWLPIVIFWEYLKQRYSSIVWHVRLQKEVKRRKRWGHSHKLIRQQIKAFLA